MTTSLQFGIAISIEFFSIEIQLFERNSLLMCQIEAEDALWTQLSQVTRKPLIDSVTRPSSAWFDSSVDTIQPGKDVPFFLSLSLKADTTSRRTPPKIPPI